MLDLIYRDLCGHFHVPSLNGSKYILMFVDDFSGMYFTYFLKHRNEALGKLILLKKIFENLIGAKIKHFRSDNGLEQ